MEWATLSVNPAVIISPRQVLLSEIIYRTVCQCWGIFPLQKLKLGRGGVRTPPPESLPNIASNYRAQTQDEQKRVARDLSACYSDKVCSDYHSRVQIYKSPDKRRKKDDATALTAVHTHLEFERHCLPKKLPIFINALPRCLLLTIGFNMVGQKWTKIYCLCLKAMEGWVNANKCQRHNDVEPCQNKGYSPKSILKHVAKKSEECMHHFAIQQYLSSLYCTIMIN